MFGRIAINGNASKAKRASGASVGISLATSASGNYDNSLIVALYDNSRSYNALFENGSNSTTGSATSPDRKVQAIDVRISDIEDVYDDDGTTVFFLVLGGYVRHTGSSISSIHWQTGTGAQSSSLSNGVSIISLEVEDDREHTQDNTAFDGSFPEGIYHSQNFSSGSGFYANAIQLGSGGALPTDGDSATFRITVDANVDGTTVSTILDVILNFVT